MRKRRPVRSAIPAAVLLLVVVIVFAYAWINGGAETVRDIVEPVQPEALR